MPSDPQLASTRKGKKAANDQEEQAAEAPQINVAADSVADAVDTENPACRVVGHTITFPPSLLAGPLGVQQEEEPVSSMTRAIQIMVPVTSPAAQAA